MKIFIKKASFLRKYNKSNTYEGFLQNTKEDKEGNFILIKETVNQEGVTILNIDTLCIQLCCPYFH